MTTTPSPQTNPSQSFLRSFLPNPLLSVNHRRYPNIPPVLYHSSPHLPRASDRMHFVLAALVSLALATTGYARAWTQTLPIIGSGFYDNFRFDNIPDPTNGRV